MESPGLGRKELTMLGRCWLAPEGLMPKFEQKLLRRGDSSPEETCGEVEVSTLEGREG